MKTIHSATSYYGAKGYPLTLALFPEKEGDIEGVKCALRRNHPGCERIESLQVSERPEVPGFCKAATVYHTPDFAIVVEYQ